MSEPDQKPKKKFSRRAFILTSAATGVAGLGAGGAGGLVGGAGVTQIYDEMISAVAQLETARLLQNRVPDDYLAETLNTYQTQREKFQAMSPADFKEYTKQYAIPEEQESPASFTQQLQAKAILAKKQESQLG